jgi:hypothetical protein
MRPLLSPGARGPETSGHPALREGSSQRLHGGRSQHRLDGHEERALLEADVIVEEHADLLQERAKVPPRRHRSRERLREPVQLGVLLTDPLGPVRVGALATREEHLLLVRHVPQELVSVEGEIGLGRPCCRSPTVLGPDAVAGPAESLGTNEGVVVVPGEGDQRRIPTESVRPWRVLRRPSALHPRQYRRRRMR